MCYKFDVMSVRTPQSQSRVIGGCVESVPKQYRSG